MRINKSLGMMSLGILLAGFLVLGMLSIPFNWTHNKWVLFTMTTSFGIALGVYALFGK